MRERNQRGLFVLADHKEAGAKKNAELHDRAEAKAKAAKALADQK
jgi:hypothetical protein